jgi:hypothetical protein
VPLVWEITRSDGTTVPTRIRVPSELAVKMDDEMNRVREVWRDDWLARREEEKAAARRVELAAEKARQEAERQVEEARLAALPPPEPPPPPPPPPEPKPLRPVLANAPPPLRRVTR